MLPSIFGEKWFDDFFDFPTSRDFGKRNTSVVLPRAGKDLMRTDVREHDNGYELEIDLPGFKKNEISVSVENGYMTVEATKTVEENKDESQKASEGTYIRRERYTGSCSRTFYIGEEVSDDEIAASFEDGILKLSIPKKAPEAVETKKYITIA